MALRQRSAETVNSPLAYHCPFTRWWPSQPLDFRFAAQRFFMAIEMRFLAAADMRR